MLALLIISFVLATGAQSQRCPTGKVHDACGSACPPTCRNPSPVCTRQCINGCFCPRFTVLDEGTGRCVGLHQCPAQDTVPTAESVCPENEVFNGCGTACPDTCQEKPVVCTFQCVGGCFCANGFIRDETTGKCGKPQQCPNRVPTDESVCPDNEKHNRCGTACPTSCQEPDSKLCHKGCANGCFCVEGFIRDETTGKCVEPQQCPNQACPIGEVEDTCGDACPPTCLEPHRVFCAELPSLPPGHLHPCVRGCFCPPGLLRDEGTGKCVEPQQCPNQDCPPFEEHSDCGTACESTCSETPQLCTANCVSGCFCTEDRVRIVSNGTCVLKNECQKPPTQ